MCSADDIVKYIRHTHTISFGIWLCRKCTCASGKGPSIEQRLDGILLTQSSTCSIIFFLWICQFSPFFRELHFFSSFFLFLSTVAWWGHATLCRLLFFGRVIINRDKKKATWVLLALISHWLLLLFFYIHMASPLESLSRYYRIFQTETSGRICDAEDRNPTWECGNYKWTYIPIMFFF